MMIGIVQSSFLPWRGFFDLMDDVDLLILYDDVAFSSKSWRSRNKIKTPSGSKWISVPVQHSWPRKSIDQTEIDSNQNWRERLQHQIQAAYQKAPYYTDINKNLFKIIDQEYTTISELNHALIKFVADQLSIVTPLRQAREFNAIGDGEDRVFNLLEKIGAKALLNGPTAEAYSTLDRYKRAGIDLFFKVYEYPSYPQLFGAYEPQLSIIDLLFNCGSNSHKYLKSCTAMRSAGN